MLVTCRKLPAHEAWVLGEGDAAEVGDVGSGSPVPVIYLVLRSHLSPVPSGPLHNRSLLCAPDLMIHWIRARPAQDGKQISRHFVFCGGETSRHRDTGAALETTGSLL